MISRGSNLRIKVVALLLSLVALWVFAATVTLREGLNLFWVSTLAEEVGKPADALVAELQQERRLTLAYLGGGTAPQRTKLVDQRARTDKARTEFEDRAGRGTIEQVASDALVQRIDETKTELKQLSNVRDAVDTRRIRRDTAALMFTAQIDSAFRIYGSMSTLDDPDIAKQSRTLIALSRAREVLAQEDALIAGVVAEDGRLAGAEYSEFVKLVGTQRFLYAEARAELPESDRAEYDSLVQTAQFMSFRAIEDRMLAESRIYGIVPIDAAGWAAVAGSVITQQRDFALQAADRTVERATPAAIWVLVRLLLAGGLGLIAVIASIIVSITTARSLVRQLEKLRTAARDLANERLPRVVERLQRGEQVDVHAEAPPLAFGVDEIGQVGHAFNDVQATAIRVAVEQAELRQGVRDVFLSLARRSQALVHRQLTLLDTMERRTSEPEELEGLFRVDHLATRMRRNAENLIVLSGAVPGRGWRNPIPLVDVVRGAVAEVEEYERVTIAPIGSAALAGRAVGDVIHLLAELIENALSFSPPHTMVHVSGQLVGNGYAVEVEDRGLGMSAEDLDDANERLENPPEFNLSSTARLGLYVVGRLAERHHLRVRLRTSPYGGVTAVVLIPTSLVVHGESPSTAAAIANGRRDRGVPRERNVQRDRLRDATLHRGLTPVESAPSVDAPEEPHPALASDTVVIDRDAVTVAAPPVTEPEATLAATPVIEPEATPAATPVTEPEATPAATPVTEPAAARAATPVEAPVDAPLNAYEPLTVEKPLPIDEPAPVEAPAWAQEPPPVEEPRRYGATAPTEPVSTPSGLPRRVRQASLAAPLRENATAETAPTTAHVRPPEEVRRMMSSYQKGTVQGRVDSEESEQTTGGDEPPIADGTPTEAGISQNSGDR